MTASKLGGGLAHAVAPAIGHCVLQAEAYSEPMRALSALYFSSSLGKLVSPIDRSSAIRRSWPSTASRMSRSLRRLDLDHLVGVNLVDLAQLFVACGLGGGERLAIVFLDAFQLFVAAGGDLLALLLESGVDHAAAESRQRIGVGQGLHERRVAFELRSWRA